MVTNTSAAIAGDQKNIIILEEKRQETKKELECQKNLLKLKKSFVQSGRFPCAVKSAEYHGSIGRQ